MRKLLAFAIAVAITLATISVLVGRARREETGPAPLREQPEARAPVDSQITTATETESSRTPAVSSTVGTNPSADGRSKARLIVLVVSEKNGSPLAKVRVGVFRKTEQNSHVVTDVDGSVGDFDHRPITGLDGRAELALDPDLEFGVAAQGDFGDAGAGEVDVQPLRPGEERTVTVKLPSGIDAHLFGKVVADESDAPIEGARVSISYDQGEGIRTGSDGRFELELSMWKRPFLEINAKGFGPAFVVPGTGYGSTADEPIVVFLVRSGTLLARITNHDGKPVTEGLVSVAAKGYELIGAERNFRSEWVSPPDQEWGKPIDQDGVCRFEGLPSGISLQVEISVPHREAKRDGVPISLLPGQVLEREWRFDAGCALKGRVVNAEDAPIRGIPLWLVKSDPGSIRRFDPFSIEKKERRTRSGEDGAFEFADVDPGSWLIGPAPEENEKHAIAAFPEIVEVPLGTPEVVHDIRIYRGLHIRGRVVDSKEQRAPDAYVSGWMLESGWFVDAQGKKDGTFELGPLVPGKYEIHARAPFEQDAESDPLTASAGDADVILRLRAGGSLSGKVVDARTGAPCVAELVVSQHGDRDRGYLCLPHSKEDGSFQVQGLPAGDYDVAARTPDGRFGWQIGVAVQAGAESTDVLVSVEPGAKLRIRYDATSGYGQMQVRAGGSVVAADGLAAGSTVVVVVPAGRVVAELMSPPQTSEVDLAVGEEKTVVLTGPK